MKLQILSCALILSLTVVFSSCGEQANPNENETAPNSPIEIIKGKLPTFEIKEDDAVQSINKYKTYIDGVIDTLGDDENTKKLIYGARVELNELRQVLYNTSTVDTNANLYIMLGVVPNDSTELIFSLQSGIDSSWQYYDFTLPCPTGCPEWFEIGESY